MEWHLCDRNGPREDGGEKGIRTLGTVSRTHAFQACSFNHSDISPFEWNLQSTGAWGPTQPRNACPLGIRRIPSIGTALRDDGFDSPESAAMFGFPPKYCRVVASRTNGDRAYILLDTGSHERPYLYGVSCRRDNGRWFEGGSANRGGWEQTDHDPDVGTLSFWDKAPDDADMVRVEFNGSVIEQPVVGGAYLVVWWRVPNPRDWPRATAFRIGDRWVR
jgi:hypothetical protein